MKNMSYISKQDIDDLMEGMSFVSKSGIKQKSLLDDVIKESKKEKLTDEEVKELLSTVRSSEVSPEIYAELHPESVIIKEHNKKLANTCEFKTKAKTCAYKNYWEKCAFCKKEVSR